MLLQIKVLGGQECSVEAQEDTSVEQLKKDLEQKLKLGKTEQKLLFKGKTLQGKNYLFNHYNSIHSEFSDGTPLSSYNIKDGAKLNLILKREAATPTTKSGPSAQNPRSVDNKFGPPEEELFKILRKHFANDAETKRVVATFMTASRFVI